MDVIGMHCELDSWRKNATVNGEGIDLILEMLANVNLNS
ncbi:unnamed protein product, partial [Rotaria sp. Silwood1]